MPNLKESLPMADTFKYWIRRFRVWVLISVVLLILAGVGIGVVSYKAGSTAMKDLLTLKDVLRTVKKAGLALKQDQAIDVSNYKIGDTLPKVYTFELAKGNLFIYQFPSIEKRETSYRTWLDGQGVRSNVFNVNSQFNRAYAAKNTLLVYTLGQLPNKDDIKKVTTGLLETLGKTIFYDLNGGQQIVYQGEGEHWKGKVTLNYYQHFWKDENGVIQYEGWHREQPILEFKGEPATIKGKFSYEFKSPEGGFAKKDTEFNEKVLSGQDSFVNYGGSLIGFGSIGGDGGAVPQADSIYTVTVKWNGDKQETFELKAAPPIFGSY